MRRPRARRLIAVLAIVLGLGPTSVGAAMADDPVTGGVSNVKTDGANISGVLTLRGKDAVQVDPGSLKATIDGQSVPATIRKIPGLERRAMLVIDTSGSMGQSGMATVRAATASYLRAVPPDVLVGVVSFASTAGVDLAPTKNRAAVQRVVNGLASRGNTSLFAAMQSAIKALGANGDRSIVLLSDGADTMAGDKAAARGSVMSGLKAASVRVDVVQFRTTDPDATTALRGFALANGGSVVSAGDTAAVASAFQSSAKSLDAQVQFTIVTPEPLSGAHALELQGKAGSSSFGFQQSVDFIGASPTLTPAPSAKPAGTPSGDTVSAAVPWATSPTTQENVYPWVAAGLVALGVLVLAGTSLTPTLQTRRELRVAAIENYVLPVRTKSRAEGKQQQQTALTGQLINFGERAMKDRKSTHATMQLMDRADLPLRAGEWFVLRGIAVVIGTAGGAVLAGEAYLIGLGVGAALGLLIPPLVLRFLAKRRATAFERILPDVLMLVSTSLRSGFGLPQALDAVSRDAAEPAAKEFSRALAETRIGTDVPDALERMAERMDSTAMRWTVMAIRIQRDVGGNLADTLHTTAGTLREREVLRRMVLALSAEGRLSAWILVALPIGVFFYLMAVSREYVSLLWTTSMGLMMCGMALVLMALGIVWMQKIVKIEV